MPEDKMLYTNNEEELNEIDNYLEPDRDQVD